MNKTTTLMRSRREFLKLAGQSTLAMTLLPSCTSSKSESSSLKSSSIMNDILEKPISEISLETKIGQMLLVGFRGTEIKSQEDPIIQDIQKRQIGGVLLFNYDIAQKSPVRNIQSARQVQALIQILQASTKIPLLVGIDYEGGVVTRLPEKYGFPITVSHQYLGNKNKLELTRQYATEMANTLAQLGINLNFAPVVDVNTNPQNPIIAQKERSFSADPNIVAAHALEFIKAHHSQNVLCSLKHFPGHGSSTADSHLGMVDVTDTWSQKELIPYTKIIQADEADAIMTAHVFNKEIDPNYPATLSQPTITGLLRKGLNYKGVVFSDDMQMKAIANHYGLETAVHKAIEAGVDILVLGNNTGDFVPDIAARTFNIIKYLVQTGAISEQRINESYQRIFQLKRLPIVV